MCSWSMMTDLGHLEQAGAGVRRAMSPRISPAAVLRTGYASSTGIVRLMRRHSPRGSSSARSGCYSVNKVLRELSLLANYASLFRATSLRHILDDELQLGPPPAPPPPLTSEESRTAGCVVAFVIAELRAPSRSSTAGGATPHASQSCSREPPPPPLACPPRAAPLAASRPSGAAGKRRRRCS